MNFNNYIAFVGNASYCHWGKGCIAGRIVMIIIRLHFIACIM